MNLTSTINLTHLANLRHQLPVFALFTVFLVSSCVSQQSTSINATKNQLIVQKKVDVNEAAEQRLNLGLQYLQNGQVDRAKHHLDKALKHAPNKASVQIGMAYYYEQVKDYKRAENYYRKALRLDPKNGDYLNLYGSFLCNQGNYSEAEKYFKTSVDQADYANMASTYENSGVCAVRAGNLKMAEIAFRKALDHNKNSSISLLEMSEIWFQKKNYFEARAFLSRHLSNTQVSPRSLWLGIQIERIHGDDDALSTYALKLTRLFPKSDETKLYLDSIK